MANTTKDVLNEKDLADREHSEQTQTEGVERREI